MIITAKATQPQTQSRPADPAEAYVLKNAYEKSKAPYAFFLVLMGRTLSEVDLPRLVADNQGG
jgi:hypothetical protein